ncbi:MAG: DUF2237 domain-containing protein [Candidatus Sericytochromatia bacterium]|nr:DUF2237 domain-containing protein [Candidatus Sericytochromatia bacterium]
MSVVRNVLGENLRPCSMDPLTGFHRDGYCNCGPEDPGQHLVCVEVNAEFLAFSQSRGNDLSTPYPQFGFPGLKPGDKWCLCLLRWIEAYKAGKAPPVDLASTHERVLERVSLEILQAHALEPVEG